MSGPTPAPYRWPYREHRNMAQVIADDEAQARMRHVMQQTAIIWNKEPSNGSIRPNKIED